MRNHVLDELFVFYSWHVLLLKNEVYCENEASYLGQMTNPQILVSVVGLNQNYLHTLLRTQPTKKDVVKIEDFSFKIDINIRIIVT